MNPTDPGKIVTFYSYKGGTGRSMALANVAWILASNGLRVLAVDWDLESPGLHRYFHPFLVDRGQRSAPGVIDLVWEFASAAMAPGPADESWVDERTQIMRYAASLDREFVGDGTLDFVSAGRLAPDYGVRVSKLDWEVLYNRQGGGAFIEALRENMRANYDYVLIDSRTGVSDTAGVCTVALPDVLVNCFTLSTQSIDGALMVARSVEQQTKREVRMLPVPMRVEDAEKTKLEAGRDYARSCFAGLLPTMSHEEQERYWGDVEIPYKPFYAYEEILATIGDRPHQENTLLTSFERLARVVTDGSVGELVPMAEPERRRRLAEFERTKLPVSSDVFVSYAEQDRMWAEWIAFELESAGYGVVREGSDFAAGADIRSEIDRTVSTSACTIAIVTPDYIESPQARVTWDAALARDPLGNQGLLVPVNVGQFRPMGVFASRVAIELAGLSADQAREELLASMREPGVTPSEPAPAGRSPVEGPRFPGAEPQVFNVPLRNPNFVGRDALLLDLRARLASTSTAAVLPQALHGLGGVGKTQVALEYAHRFAPDYDLVWWVGAEQVAEARSALTALAPHLGLDPGDDAGETLRTVLDALRRGEPFRRWLLVFDNADAATEIQQLLPHGTQPHDAGHVIITSRNQSWSDVGDTVEVDVFSRDESIQLLRRRGRQIPPADADRLAARLGDLPLAIEQAAVWQAETAMPVDEYLELFEEQHTQLLSQGAPDHYTTSVAATWTIAFERLREQHPASLQLLELCAFFGADPIPFRLLTMGRFAPSLPSPLAETLPDTILRRRAVREVGRYALARVDPGRDTLLIHRLVQDVLRERLTDEQRAAYRASAHELLAAANPGNPDNKATWEQHAAVSPHIAPARLIEAASPIARKVVLDQVRFRYRRGDFDGSFELAEAARDRWTSALGPDDPQTLEASQQLADAMWWLGRNAEARELRQRTFDRMRQVLGEDHELTLTTANGIGSDLRWVGAFQRAHEHDAEYLELHRRVFGEDDPATLRSANNLAIDLKFLGRFARALELDQEILDRRRRTLRDDDSEILGTVASVARDLIGLGDYQGAVAALQQPLEDFRRDLGPSHADVVRASRVHATALRKSGRYDEALSLNEENLAVHTSRFGEDHRDTFALLMGICSDRRVAGDLEGAQLAGHQMLAGYQRVLGPDHPIVFAAMATLAIVTRRSGDIAAARSLDGTALAGLERTVGPENPFALCAKGNLASDLSAADDHSAARRLSEELLDVSRQVRGAEHPYTLGCALNLALDLEATGDPGRSERLRASTLDQMRAILGDEHPEVADAMRRERAEFDLDPTGL